LSKSLFLDYDEVFFVIARRSRGDPDI